MLIQSTILSKPAATVESKDPYFDPAAEVEQGCFDSGPLGAGLGSA